MLIGFRREERYVTTFPECRQRKYQFALWKARMAVAAVILGGLTSWHLLLNVAMTYQPIWSAFAFLVKMCLNTNWSWLEEVTFALAKRKLGKCMCARSIKVGWENGGTESICQHPEHKGKLKGVIGDRVFNVQLSRDVFEVFGIIIPIGSREYHFKSGRSFCLL